MRRVLLLGILLTATSTPRLLFAQSPIRTEIAPNGKLRVSFNAATAVLLTRAPDNTMTGGVGLELGKLIARKLGVVLELAPYPNSDSFFQSYAKGEWDIGFGTKSPLVADEG